MSERYAYDDVRVYRVIDGDTVDLTLSRDIGFYHRTSVTVRFRLVEINTPERGQFGYDEAKAFTTEWLTEREQHGLVAYTYKHQAPATVPDGGFGRWLVDVVDAYGERLVDALREVGLAAEYRGS